jgi:lysophospholipase L1-like esterase
VASRGRELAQNLLLAGASTVLFLAVLEGAARLAGQRPCQGLAQQAEGAGNKVRAHPLRQYELVPGSEFTFDREAAVRHGLSPDYLDAWERVTYRVNSLGLRGEDVSLAKSAGTQRILVLGDSVGFGWGIEEQDTLSNQLQQLLGQSRSGQHFEVWNAGVPGYATWQELAYLVEKGAAFRPDWVVVPFLFNDVDGNNEAVQGQPFGMSSLAQALIQATQKSAVLCYLRNQALEFRLKRLHACRGPNCWGMTEQVLDGLVAQCRKLNCGLALVAFPMRLQVEPGAEPGYYDRALGANPQQGYQDVISRLCAERGIPYLDLLPAYEEAMTATGHSLFLDADHPNAEGSRLAAQVMLPFLEQLVME